jgi:peptidoglycan/xylan/chitin deacetylase (PgdA/CDA1 family)
MTYGRPADSRALRLLFVLVLLELGIVLPLASAVLAPVSSSMAAAALPTAYVRVPTARPELVALAGGQLIASPQRTAANQPVAVTVSVPTLEPAATATWAQSPSAAALVASVAPQAEPTLTSTPVALAPVDGAATLPVATLFPTAPAEVGAPAMAPNAGSIPPILMYHYVRTVDQASDPLGYELSVAPEVFDQQMSWLHGQGYITVPMDVVTQCLRGAAACPSKAVALTFDDGYADAYTEVLPVLGRYRFSATFYIISGIVGQPGYMTWEQIAALRDAGMEIGAHTVSHLDLTSLDWGTAGYEIAQSKADIEHHLGSSVMSFCYPTGLYNPAIEEQVRSAGYSSATTTRWDGDYSDILALPRRRVSGETSLDGFAAIVQG